MSHYDEQREKFENQRRPYFTQREINRTVSQQGKLNKNANDAENPHEILHPAD